MKLIVLLLFSLAPGVFWVWYFKRHDRRAPEPNGLLAKVFIVGMFSVLPAALIEGPLMRVWGQTPNVWIQLGFFIAAIGLVEEVTKFAVVYFTVFRDREFNEVLDGIIYGVTAAFGFAAAENFLYVYSFGWEIGPLRAIVTSLAHASFSGVVGFHLGMVQAGRESPVSVVLSLVSMAILHGIYNFVLVNRAINPLFSLLLVVALYRYLSYKIRHAQELQ